MTETYTPKVGDRVRATLVFEGPIVERQDSFYPCVVVEHPEKGKLDLGDEEGWSFEKLQDPEPQWVNGDVVKVKYFVPAHRIDDRWINPTTGQDHYFNVPSGAREIPDAWKNGSLEILYKADA